ncbi:hypothetical protein BH10PLA2_BH10PLA2_02080 [soil metagenome]
MPYVTSVKRLAKEKGARTALHSTISAGLQERFGSSGVQLISRIEAIEDLAHLQILARGSWPAESIEAFQRLLDR